MIGIAFNAGSAFDPTGRFVAVHDRQLNIHQNEVGLVLGHSRQCLDAIFSFDKIVIQRRKHIADDLAIVLLIFDHENALAHSVVTSRSTRIGSVKANVEPWPIWDSTQIFPPCISMMRLDMASPSPVPPFFLVIELSAC